MPLLLVHHWLVLSLHRQSRWVRLAVAVWAQRPLVKHRPERWSHPRALQRQQQEQQCYPLVPAAQMPRRAQQRQR